MVDAPVAQQRIAVHAAVVNDRYTEKRAVKNPVDHTFVPNGFIDRRHDENDFNAVARSNRFHSQNFVGNCALIACT